MVSSGPGLDHESVHITGLARPGLADVWAIKFESGLTLA